MLPRKNDVDEGTQFRGDQIPFNKNPLDTIEQTPPAEIPQDKTQESDGGD